MSVANNLTGKTLSKRYEILRPLGEGGMGKVYLAKDKRFGKQVVVKVPTMEAGDKDFKDRFMREIASLATLEHAHIVTTVDWGEIEGIPFLVLRYLSGGSLRDRITDAQGFYKPMPLEGLNQWLPQIASALDFIHSKNWVHRDLKPDNILFDEAGNPYLADFGIAKALEGAPMGVKTTMGAFIGTPQYMAPEMHLGKGIGPRADQFGLAVLVYEALAGKIPFAGTTPTAIFVEVMQGKARPIHELVPGIPIEKSNALMKGITKEPRDRYGSCVEFANAITGSMLARGTSSSAGSETPSRVVIPGTRMETPKKPDIPGTRIETPSKPEITGTRLETPLPTPLAVPVSTPLKIPGTRIETASKPEIAGTRLETPLNKGSKPEIRLRSEDYLTRSGLGLEQICKDLVEAGKMTKELFLEARKFCKSNDVSEIPGGLLLVEKIDSIVKTGHASIEASEDIVSLARDILGLEKPVIAGTRMETPSKPEIAGTRLERNGDKAPVVEESEEGIEEELPYVGLRDKKKKNNVAVFVLVGVVGGIALLGIILIFALGGNKAKPVVVNTESKKEETKMKAKELVKLKQEEEAKAKQMELMESKGGKDEIADLGKGIKLEMVLTPAGKFMVGDSGKGHWIILTKPYYMGKYEVTQDQWEAVMGSNPGSTKGARLPVTDVSWNDCQDFIKKLNAKTSGGYRLPTAAEWEYACRAGTSTAYSYGDSLTKSDANIDGVSIKAVGSYRPNAFGLYDLHGNVLEWCNDWYGSLQDDEVKDPKGPGTGERRVLRGGSFLYLASKVRSSDRYYSTPANRVSDFGFRLARTADIKTGVSPTVTKPDAAVVMPATANLLAGPFTETKAKEVQKEVAKSLKKEVEEKADLGKGIKLEMVLIPSGKFVMGSPASEKDRRGYETQHEVTLTKPYYMGKYEVTQDQWQAIMGSNPSSVKGARLPVTNVSWNDCQEFIKKLNAKMNSGYRLPTEAEWEYSCRAGTKTAYSVGDSITKNDAKYGTDKGAPPDNIVAVGNYKPNGFGLYDMHGNVWEWCEDWYGDYPTTAVTDPKGLSTGDRIVVRGGSFRGEVWKVRSSFRDGDTPSRKDYNFGLRLARTP
jgi:formylglycine-generating enzyme required for sulfatase activity/serine/threonine protein kinase